MSESENEVSQESRQLGPSVVLSAARERLGLSQKEVADKLFLTTTFIRYIDEGEFAKITKPAFIRGYLRSYARLVELSGDEIVAMYEAALEASEPAPEIRGVTEEEVGTSAITGPVLQTGIIGLIGLVAVISLIWWIVGDDTETEPPTVSQPGLETSAVEQVSEPEPGFDYVLPVSEAESGSGSDISAEEGFPAQASDLSDYPLEEAVQSGTRQDSEAESETEVSSAAQRSQELPTEPVSIERVRDGARSFLTVDAEGDDQVEMRFSDECWVEVTDARHEIIYQDLNREGDVLTIYGTRPFQLLLGKATGVQMIYNGRPFDLSPHIAPDRTAKLTISD
jgi:cytoskeleton protein RodZ